MMESSRACRPGQSREAKRTNFSQQAVLGVGRLWGNWGCGEAGQMPMGHWGRGRALLVGPTPAA